MKTSLPQRTNGLLETRTVESPDGTTHTIDLFAEAGAIGLATLSDAGTMAFTPLRRVRTSRARDKVGTYRWYNHHRLPDHLRRGEITVRLHGNDDDTKRRFNCTENVRLNALAVHRHRRASSDPPLPAAA